MQPAYVAILGIAFLVFQPNAQETAALKTPKAKLSYAMGMDLGKSLRSRSIDIDPAVFTQGLKDALSGGKTLLTEAEVRTTIASLQTEMRNNLIAKNKQEGEAFLAQNKTKQGIVTLPSGLQYKVLKEGAGKTPTIDDTVVCQYRGTLLDGTEFDSSYARGKPAEFPVKALIKGWAEALQLMPVGSKWQLFIPAELAYADRGMGPIGPDAVLIFEVELLGIEGSSN